jgi:hypothetical protein
MFLRILVPCCRRPEVDQDQSNQKSVPTRYFDQVCKCSLNGSVHCCTTFQERRGSVWLTFYSYIMVVAEKLYQKKMDEEHIDLLLLTNEQRLPHTQPLWPAISQSRADTILQIWGNPVRNLDLQMLTDSSPNITAEQR